MTKIRTRAFLFFLVPLAIVALGQSAAAQRQRGTVKGTIIIKNVSGNNLGNFGCDDISVTLSDLTAPQDKRWQLKTTATGDFSTRKCAYKIARVPADNSFSAAVSPQFPGGCDQKSFQTSASFPMKVSPYQTLTYDFTVTKISCTLVK